MSGSASPGSLRSSSSSGSPGPRFRTMAEPGARAVVGQGLEGVTAIGAAFAPPGLFGALGVQSVFLLERFSVGYESGHG